MRVRFVLLAIVVCSLSACLDDTDLRYGRPWNAGALHQFNSFDTLLLHKIRLAIASEDSTETILKEVDAAFQRSSFPKEFWGIALKVYQTDGSQAHAVRAKEKDLREVIQNVRRKLRKSTFDPTSLYSVQLDFIPRAPWDIPYESLRKKTMCINTFDFGYDGLKVSDGSKNNFYFLPGDNVAADISSAENLDNAIQKHFGRYDIEKLKFYKLRTASFISSKNHWLELYRGQPIYPTIIPSDVLDVVNEMPQFYKMIKRTSDKEDVVLLFSSGSSQTAKVNLMLQDEVLSAYSLLDHYKVFRKKEVKKDIQVGIVNLIKKLNALATVNKDFRIQNAPPYTNQTLNLIYALLVDYRRVTSDSTYSYVETELEDHIISTVERDYDESYAFKQVTLSNDDDAILKGRLEEQASTIKALTHYVLRDDINPRDSIKKHLKLLLDEVVSRDVCNAQSCADNRLSRYWITSSIRALWINAEFRKDLWSAYSVATAQNLLDSMYTVHNSDLPQTVGMFRSNDNHAYIDPMQYYTILEALKLAEQQNDLATAQKFKSALDQAALVSMGVTSFPYFNQFTARSEGGSKNTIRSLMDELLLRRFFLELYLAT